MEQEPGEKVVFGPFIKGFDEEGREGEGHNIIGEKNKNKNKKENKKEEKEKKEKEEKEKEKKERLEWFVVSLHGVDENVLLL